MVKIQRRGRFGQALVQQQETEEITPELIREEPEKPIGRFGRSLRVTEALRERAKVLSSVRQQAIAEAERLEQEFFGQRITVEQAQEGFEQVDPLVRQFIRTTPARRQQIANEASRLIDERILIEKQNLEAAGTRRALAKTDEEQTEAELDIIEAQTFIQELQGLKDEAQTGAFSFGELISFAQQVADARRRRSEVKRQNIQSLIKQGVPSSLAVKLIREPTTKISLEQAQKLSPQARQALGIQLIEQVQNVTQTRKLTVSELVNKGIPRDIAIKIALENKPTITLEEARRLPANLREELGVTEEDFQAAGTKTLERISEVESLRKRAEESSFFEKLLLAPAFASAAIRETIFKGAEKVTEKGIRVGFVGKGTGIPFLAPIITTSESNTAKLSKEASTKTLAITADVGTFFVPVVGQARSAIESAGIAGRVAVGDPIVAKLAPAEKEVSILEVAGVGAVGSFAARKFLRTEEIIAKEAPKRPDLRAGTEMLSVRQLERQVDVAKFVVTAFKEERKAVTVTRGELLREKVFGVKLPKKPKVEQLAAINLGKVITIEKPSAALVSVEPFITKFGKAIRPVRDADAIAFTATRATIDTKKIVPKRISPTIIGRFEGGLDRDVKKLRMLDTKKLSSLDRELVRQIQNRFAFKKEAEVFFGETQTKDLIKLLRSRREAEILDITKRARSVRRARLAAIPEEKISVQFQKEFGLKEIEALEEKITFVDVTFPRFKTPKKIDFLRGTTIRKEIELPPPKEPIIFQRGVRPKRTKRKIDSLRKILEIPEQQLKVPDKAFTITELKGAAALKAARLVQQKPLSAKQIEKQLAKETASSRARELAITKIGVGAIPRQTAKLEEKLIPAERLSPRIQFKELTKEVVKTQVKLIPKQVPRLVPKQTVRLAPKQAPKLTLKQITKLSPKIPKIPLIRPPVSKPPFRPPSKPPFRPPLIIPIPKTRAFPKPRRLRKRSRSDAALVESFTARILRLPPERIRERDIGKALERQSRNLGRIRLRPIIIPDITKKRRRRR